jgi:predicted transcriptional regulator
MGRPLKLSRDAMHELIARVDRGELLQDVAAEAGVTPQTLRRYRREVTAAPVVHLPTPDPVTIWDGRRLRDRALAALERMGRASVDELMRTLGIPQQSVRNVLGELRRDGCVQSTGLHTYEVVP